MIVQPLDIRNDLHLDIAPKSLDRSPGLHMSDIYNRLYQVLDPGRYKHDDEFSEENHLHASLLAIGLALEQYTERLLLAAGIEAHRPPEFRTPDEHGIAFSPDLLIYNGDVKGGEIKATFMSTKDLPTSKARKLPDKFDKYVTQMKSYGHNLEIPDWLLLAWFLKGDYSKRSQDQEFFADLRAFHLQFTSAEMREEYQTLVRFAQTERML